MSSVELPVNRELGPRNYVLEPKTTPSEAAIASHLSNLIDVCAGPLIDGSYGPYESTEASGRPTTQESAGSLAVAATQDSHKVTAQRTPEDNKPSADQAERSTRHKGNVQFDLVSDVVIRYRNHETTQRLMAEGLRRDPVTLREPSLALTDKLLKRLGIGIGAMKSLQDVPGTAGFRDLLNQRPESVPSEHLKSQAEAAFCEVTAALTLLATHYAPWAEKRANRFAREQKLPLKETRDEALGTLYASIAKYIKSSGIAFQCFAARQISYNLAIFAKRKAVRPRRLFTALSEFPAGEVSAQLRRSTQAQPSKKHVAYPQSKTQENQRPVLEPERVIENNTTRFVEEVTFSEPVEEIEEVLSLSTRMTMALGHSRPPRKPGRGRRTGHHGRRTTNM